MRARSIIALIGALFPVVYFGGLAFHFLDVGGSVEGATAIGLGPTILGLAVVGLLFCIPVFWKVARLFGGPRSPGSGGGGGPDGPTNDSGIDADAMIARYMAQRSAEATAGSPAPGATSPAKSGGFGRRSR